MCTYISAYPYVCYVGTTCVHTYAYSCIHTRVCVDRHAERDTPIKLNAQLISILFLMNVAGLAQIVAAPTHTTTWQLYYTIRKSSNEHNIFVINLVDPRYSHGIGSICNRRGGEVYTLICIYKYICFCKNKGKEGEYEIKVGNYAPRFSWPHHCK